MTKPAAGARPWFEFRAAKDDGPVEIRIYDSIGWWGVTASDFAAELDKVDADEIVLRINSSGGDVFDGFAIYNLLRDHPGTVRTIVDGFAASIASIIALAGDTVEVHEASVVMIHEPWGIGIGNAKELRELADVLDKTIAAPMAKIYAARMDKTVDEIRDLMEAETWWTGEEAVESGFASALITSAPPEESAAAGRDFSGFRNPPAGLADDVKPPPLSGDDPNAIDDALVGLMRRRLALQELDE
jgi:ATP-dependent protease ClpP protease subunit